MNRDIADLKDLRTKLDPSDEESSLSCFINDDFVCRSGTCILYLIKKSMKTPQSEWLTYEVDTEFKSNGDSILSINHIKDELHALIPNPQERPIIFFDECSGRTEIDKILLIRTVLRKIGLIPVFMGTDAEACRILTRTDCSRNESKPKLHAFIIHQLPPMNQKAFNDMLWKLKDLVLKTPLNPTIISTKLSLLKKV